jgi:hypothetical protein
VGAVLLETMGEVSRVSEPVVPWIAVLVIVSGLLRLLLYDPRPLARHGSRNARREMTRLNRNLTCCWIAMGMVLLGLGLAAAPIVVAGVGAAMTLAIYMRGRKLATLSAGASAAAMLTLLLFSGGAYGVAAVSQGVSALTKESPEKPKDPPPPEKEEPGPPETETAPGPPTYAELCPKLRDPLDIDFGLGALFRRDGAVKAGCGEPAYTEVGSESVHLSEGICSTRLRSLAVASPGYPSVLLYGEAAHFAKQSAANADLVSADKIEPGDGEVVAIETEDGTHLFARASASVTPGDDNAQRCSEAGGVARPFVELPPALAELWLWHMEEEERWSWPIPAPAGSGEGIGFQDEETGAVVATGGCAAEVCELDDSMHRTNLGSAIVSLEQLAPYAPEHVGEDEG